MTPPISVPATHPLPLLLACAVKGPCMVSVRVDDPPPAGTAEGAKLQVVPAGSPLPQLSETALENPRIGATVSAPVALPPAEMVNVDELELKVKSGDVTTIVTGVVVTELNSVEPE